MKVIPTDKFTKSEIELQTLLPDHPHIVQVYEAFKTENVIILVLEYCQHGDLFEHMQKRCACLSNVHWAIPEEDKE